MVGKIHEIIHKKHFFYWIIGLLSMSKLFLLGKGSFAFPDELSYLENFHIWNSLVDFNIKSTCSHIIGAQLNAGHNIVRLPSIIVQLFFLKYFDIPVMSPYSLIVPQIQNIIVHAFQLFILYKILLRVNINFNVAIVTVILFSLAVNSNLYIRHTNSYDYSLLFILLGIYFIIKHWSNITFKKGIKIGVIAALGFTVYYGHYLFPITLFSALIYHSLKSQKKYFSVFGYSLGALFIFLLFEIIAQIGGVSFFAGNALAIEGKYIGGDYKEGFIFLGKYLLENEYVIGLALLTSFLFMVFRGVKRVVDGKELNVVEVLLLSSFLAYMFHASVSFIFENKLFYGRTLKMFYPFLFIALALSINDFLKRKTFNTVLIILVIVSLSSYFLFMKEYLPLGYPRDVLAHRKININTIQENRVINESPPYFIFGSAPAFNKKYCFKKAEDIKLVNFSYIHFNLNQYEPYNPQKNEKVIFEALHFQSFLPYTYEEKTPKERDLMKKRAYKIKIFKTQ